MFTLVLKALFSVIKSNENIKGLNTFDHKFLSTYHTQGTTFFLTDNNPVFQILDIFHKFPLVFWLKLNATKCEIAGIATLKGASVALCGMKYFNLMKKTVTILSTYFSYNKVLKHGINF